MTSKTMTTKTADPTELELALAKARDIYESAYHGEIRNNLKALKVRAEQIADGHDFIRFQDSGENSFALNVEHGQRLNGRIFVSINDREQIHLVLTIFELNEKFELWSEQNSRGYLHTISMVDQNPFGINNRNLVNSKLVDHLVTKMIQRIEYHVLSSIPE